MTILPCADCGGEGRIWRGRLGGNDPDVIDDGPCQHCSASGTEPCAECGEAAAESVTLRTKKIYLCALCADEFRDPAA